jgi:hypothetical protein
MIVPEIAAIPNLLIVKDDLADFRCRRLVNSSIFA